MDHHITYFWFIYFNYIIDIKPDMYVQFSVPRRIFWYICFPVPSIVNLNLLAKLLITLILTIHYLITPFLNGNALAIPTSVVLLRVTLNGDKNQQKISCILNERTLLEKDYICKT